MTQDIPFRVLAEEWQRADRAFAGLVFVHQRFVSFGYIVNVLDLIGKVTDVAYWRSGVVQIPL